MKANLRSQRGIAMTVVIVAILLLSILAASALTFGFHQRKLSQQASGDRTQKFYIAKSASVDADERMRTDSGLTYAGNPDCSESEGIANPDCKPLPYYLDVDGDGKLDVRITISLPDSETGLRTVQSKTIQPAVSCSFCATADCVNFCDGIACCCTDENGDCI